MTWRQHAGNHLYRLAIRLNPALAIAIENYAQQKATSILTLAVQQQALAEHQHAVAERAARQ